MMEDEIQARMLLIGLLPRNSQQRYEQERQFITELIGSAPRAAGKAALAWWQEPVHPNHALLPTVLRGIRTREPEQALQILEVLTEPSKRKALCGWIGSLDYATEAQILLMLLRCFRSITWQSREAALIPFEEILVGIRFVKASFRIELIKALIGAVEILPETEWQQRLMAKARALPQDALHEGN